MEGRVQVTHSGQDMVEVEAGFYAVASDASVSKPRLRPVPVTTPQATLTDGIGPLLCLAATPDGTMYYASLAGSHIARLDSTTGAATVIEPPTQRQGARRVWADSQGNIWVSEWNVGQVARYTPASGSWREWRLPGNKPGAYAVYVDDLDKVWLSDFGANALVRFDSQKETFDVFPLPSAGANVRQLLGRHGEVWGAESGVDKLVVVRTASR